MKRAMATYPHSSAGERPRKSRWAGAPGRDMPKLLCLVGRESRVRSREVCNVVSARNPGSRRGTVPGMSTTSSVAGEQRRRALVEMLERAGSVQLSAAAAELGVSEMTIRRDLDGLEQEGIARRVRGGATRAV